MRISPSRKKLIWRVRPGDCETRASALRPVSALMRLDLPTFERPTKAISGSSGGGIASLFAAPAMNSQGPANRRLAAAISSVENSLTRQRIRGRVFLCAAGKALEKACEVHVPEDVHLHALPAHHHILLHGRQEVVPRPVDDEAGGKPAHHEREDQRHEREHPLL